MNGNNKQVVFQTHFSCHDQLRGNYSLLALTASIGKRFEMKVYPVKRLLLALCIEKPIY